MPYQLFSTVSLHIRVNHRDLLTAVNFILVCRIYYTPPEIRNETEQFNRPENSNFTHSNYSKNAQFLTLIAQFYHLSSEIDEF